MLSFLLSEMTIEELICVLQTVSDVILLFWYSHTTETTLRWARNSILCFYILQSSLEM